MLDIVVTNTDVLEMTDKLNELLKNSFKVLHIDKEMLKLDESNPNNLLECFYIYLRSENIGWHTCRISVRDFQIKEIEGTIFMSEIDCINNALAKIKEMGMAS